MKARLRRWVMGARRSVARIRRCLPGSGWNGGLPTHWVHPSSAWFQDRDQTAGMWRQLFPAEAVELPPVARHGLPIDAGPEVHRLEPVWIAKVRNGRYLASDLALLMPDRAFLPECSLWCGDDFSRHSVFSRVGLPKPDFHPGQCLLLEPGQANYYHLIAEGLPRLRLLELAGGDPGNLSTVIGGRQPEATVSSLERCFGLRAAWLPSFGTRLYEAESLWFTSPGTTFGRWSVYWLRSRMSVPAGRGSRRLWITRQGARCRRVVNEAELGPLFERHGITPVRLDALGLDEQIRLFAETSMIIGPHGAGLVNQVFMPSGGEVLELRHVEHTDVPVHMFRKLAALCGHRYRLMGTDGPKTGAIGSSPSGNDLRVDPEALARMLEEAGCR